MSITAGYRPLPASGRLTSPTKFTPSLAGIVTSDILVIADAEPGAAASRPAVSRAMARSARRARTGIPFTKPQTSVARRTCAWLRRLGPHLVQAAWRGLTWRHGLHH